ncbi:MAG: hypothetical protein QMD36_03365 [Candidatus Aenigmarchaeota archaeon]|nr:hypothetical protein [Candidatus Aenigmarchaeota archaeon]
MNSKLFVVVTSAILLLTAVPVFAADFPVEAPVPNREPRVFECGKWFDIGIEDTGVGSDAGVNPTEWRLGMYAFTGENIHWIVVVRDLNGAEDISYAKVTVDGLTEALCRPIIMGDGECYDEVPAWETAQDGFDSRFDKAFECIVTVEPQWYGGSSVNIDGYDQTGAYSTMDVAEQWFFNPAIIVDLDTNDGAPKIWFEQRPLGQKAPSGNRLEITNLAEGGVLLWLWISADDLTDPTNSGAICPDSNVLDVDQYMEYKGQIGTFIGPWSYITNPSAIDGCEIPPATCEGAQPLLGPGTDPLTNILGNMLTAEVQFRLEYPIPCTPGTFTQGLIHIIVRAV